MWQVVSAPDLKSGRALKLFFFRLQLLGHACKCLLPVRIFSHFKFFDIAFVSSFVSIEDPMGSGNFEIFFSNLTCFAKAFLPLSRHLLNFPSFFQNPWL